MIGRLLRGALPLLVVLVGVTAADRSADAKSMHMDVRVKKCAGGCEITVALRPNGDRKAVVSVIPQARRSQVTRPNAHAANIPGGVHLGTVTLGNGTETHTFKLEYGGELKKGTEFGIVTGWGSSHVWGGVTSQPPKDGVLP